MTKIETETASVVIVGANESFFAGYDNTPRLAVGSHHSTVAVGFGAIAVCAQEGKSQSGPAGVSIAGLGGKSAAGIGGCLVIAYMGLGLLEMKCVDVDGVKIRPDVFYKLDKEGNFIEA